MRIEGVLVLAIVAGCGRIGFGGDDALTARLVVGASTADLEICGAPSTYWITTEPVTGALDPATLAERVAALPVTSILHDGSTPVDARCTTIPDLRIGPEQIAIHAYAVTDARDEAAAATATMMPTWTRQTTDDGVDVWVHLPESMYRDPTAAAPALVFLHGWGHSEGVNANGAGVDTMPRDSGFLELFGQDIVGANPPRTSGLIGQPFIVLAPNCVQPTPARDSPFNCWGWASAEDLYDRTMRYARARYAIDDRRVYATGLSTGGEGAFRLASTRSAEIAAAVPIASTYANRDFRVCDAVGVPIWAFHSWNDTDQNTKHEQSETIVDTLKACSSATPVQLDRGNWRSPTGDGHTGWLEVYGDTHGMVRDAFTSIYPWLLSHQR